MVEDVLVAPAESVSRAADLATPELLSVLLQSAIFLPREKAENDRRYRQIIPYVVLRYGDDLFSYVRISGSETRLEGKVSVGIGGHVSRADLSATGVERVTEKIYWRALEREVEEEVQIRADHHDRLLGLLISDREDVDRVHVGLMHEWLLDRPDVEANSSEIGHATFQSIEMLKQDPRLEEWGRLALNMIASN